MQLTTEELAYYVERCKEHENLRVSTNNRLSYWAEFFKNKN